MNKLKFIIILFALSMLPALSDGQPSRKSRRPGKPDNEKNDARVFRNPARAIKRQEAKEKKIKKNYADFVKKSRKRSIAIQSPDVQERMKQNHQSTKDYYKSINKKQSPASKRARKKYNK